MIKQGTFDYFYKQIRIENLTSGNYAHNDLLQIAVETGLFGVNIFIGIFISIFANINKSNAIPAFLN